MNQRTFFADGVLLLVALIWGSAFVAQRLGMDHMEPWSFNAVRFLIGSFALTPLLLFQRRRGPIFTSSVWLGGIALGLAMMFAAGLQQAGLVYTTAGKSLITCLYIVLVPVIGLLIEATARDTWWELLLPCQGSPDFGDDLALNYGDMLTMIGALFWTVYMLLIANWHRAIMLLPWHLSSSWPVPYSHLGSR